MRYCKYDGCNKCASYNNEGKKKAIYCTTHKLKGMVDVIHKKCKHQGCKKNPTYNNEGKKAIYCATHKLNGMINVRSKKCNHEGCNKQPNYNTEDKKKGLYCFTHKLKGMIDVVNKKCTYEGCKKQPNYNNEDKKRGVYCVTHKLKGMVNVVSKRCKTHLCDIIIRKKYEGYCLRCFIYTFPNKPVCRNYKTKESAVANFVKRQFQDLSWKTDKTIHEGCSKRRPDMLLDLGYQVLIIEIDENQHTSYDCSCDNKRIMELSQDVNHRPIIFIRFNPDMYYNNGKKITSCWGNNKLGICIVKKNKQLEWDERLNRLKESINYWVDEKNKTDKTIETIELFYDVNVVQI